MVDDNNAEAGRYSNEANAIYKNKALKVEGDRGIAILILLANRSMISFLAKQNYSGMSSAWIVHSRMKPITAFTYTEAI